MLVAVVVGMGFELPSERQARGWVEAGRSWVLARVGEIDELRGVTEAPVATVGRSESTVSVRAVDDAAFIGILDSMAAAFRDDLADAPAGERLAEVSDQDEPEPAPRVERLSTALELTRQAAIAWASVMRSGIDQDEATR
jgi:hypothetical protein